METITNDITVNCTTIATLNVRVDINSAYDKESGLLNEFLAIVFAILVASVMFLLYFIDKTIRTPIHELGDAAKHLKDAVFTVELPKVRSGEVGALIQAFDDMRNSLRLTPEKLVAQAWG